MEQRNDRDERTMVRRHISQGERHVARQHEIIAGLRGHDLDTIRAEALLVEFEHTLTLHRAHLARLIGQNPN